MSQPIERVYEPGPHMPRYQMLYKEFVQLHDYFGKGGNEVMHRLHTLSD